MPRRPVLRAAQFAALLCDALAVAGCPKATHPPVDARPVPIPSPVASTTASAPATSEPTPPPEPTSPSAAASSAAPRISATPYAPPAERLAACVDGQRNLTAGLRPGKKASYTELRHVGRRAAPPGGSALFATGTPCAAAPDVAACSRSLQSPPFEPGFGRDCGSRYARPLSCASVLLVDGTDGVLTVADATALVAYLAPIDSADEASLVAYSVGYPLPSCTDQPPKKLGKNWVVTIEHVTSDCPLTFAEHTLSIAESGEVKVVGERNVRRTTTCVGRRPPGFVSTAPDADAATPAAFLAECAVLEAAAVTAFDALGRELAALGAPAALRRGCREAVADEVRHTRAMRRLAARCAGNSGTHRARRATAPSRRGPEPPSPSNARRRAEELARENAVEGCVRETFGALVGLHQAAHAEDGAVRRAMRAVAADEVRHALLSWRIARWLEPRLSRAARRRVSAERLRAVAALRSEVSRPLARDLETLLGLPGPRAALAMLGALEQSLWGRSAFASGS